LKKQGGEALRAAAHPPYPFSMIRLGRLALSPFLSYKYQRLRQERKEERRTSRKKNKEKRD